jgi:hypothetical protein
VLVQRRTKHRREYAGPAATPEEAAYAAGGQARAIQVALASTYSGRAETELAVALASPVLNGRLGEDVLTEPVRAALSRIAQSARAKGLIDDAGMRTATGGALMKDLRDEYGQLWPGYHPDWATLTGDQRAWAVAVYGTAALAGIDRELAALYPVTE